MPKLSYVYAKLVHSPCISRRLDPPNIPQEEWAREAMTALSMEVQDQILLMKMEYRSMGQVCAIEFPLLYSPIASYTRVA